MAESATATVIVPFAIARARSGMPQPSTAKGGDPRCIPLWGAASLIETCSRRLLRCSPEAPCGDVGACIDLFEACSAFTRVTACTLALSPMRDTLSEGSSYIVTSIAAPVASGWSDAGWDFHPLESAAFPRRTPLADISRIEIPQRSSHPRYCCAIVLVSTGGDGSETSRVHYSARRRRGSGVVANGARAAARDAGDRVS